MSSRRAVLSVSAIVFVAAAAMTIATSASMAAMGDMRMPGGWTMSHMWMVMPGQSLAGATASFAGMWVVMMVAMMMPTLTPSLLRYRESLGHGVGALTTGWLITVAGVAYFAVWAAVGVVVFPLGVAVGAAAMREPGFAHTVPLIAISTLVAASLVQLWMWKVQYVAHCRDSSRVGLARQASLRAAWRHGLCLGLHCVRACASLTVAALCLGFMDLRVMAAMTVTITVERRWHVFGRFFGE